MTICKGTLKNGKNCRYHAINGMFCNIHSPKETCSICYTNNTNFTSSCKHKFCRSCISTWLKSNDTCPCCRAKASHEDFKRLKIQKTSYSTYNPEHSELFLYALERLLPNYINRDTIVHGQPFITITLDSPIVGRLRFSYRNDI